MTKKIIIKSQNNFEVITLGSFKLNYDNVLRQLTFDLIIKYDIFYAKSLIEAEESDFIELRDRLKKMYDYKIKTFFFEPMGDQIYIKFNLLETGKIDIEVKLKNISLTGELFMKFNSDMTFIPQLIRDINNAILD